MSNVMGPEDAITWLNTDDYDSAGYNVAVEHAIGALEKQIPMKPIHHKTYGWISDTYGCPICREKLEVGYGCKKCLQAIDWSDK